MSPGLTLYQTMDNKEDLDTSTTSTTQRAYVALRDAIITGEIAPGEKLKVENLKTTLSMGTAPVREALSLLTSDQLVERRDQRGFRAAQASKGQFEEILNLRCKLEVLALQASISQGGKQWEDDLVLAHHHMARAYDQPANILEPHHKNFHMALISACESPILMRFCDQLYSLNIRYRNFASHTEGYEKRNVAAEHQDILDAAVNRDTLKASTILIDHYRITGKYLADFLTLA